MDSSTSVKPPSSLRNVLILVVPLVVVAVALAFWFSRQAEVHDVNYLQMLADYHRRYGPRSRLDESRYQDRDGDLIADPPSEPAQLLKPEKLVLLGLSQDDPEKARSIWKDLTDHLGKRLGRPVEYDLSLAEPEAQLRALRDGKLHVTAFSTGLVPAAVNSAGFVPVCVPADARGNFAYQMEIIVPADSPAQSPADLKGRQVTFSNMASNAGLKAPVYLLRANFGLELGKDYSFNISGSYSESLRGIASKRFQAAAVANDLLEREVARGTLSRDQFRSIFKSESFPPMCFGHGHALDPELARQVRAALLEFPWKGTSVEAEYGPAGLSRFAEVNYKTDWSFVRAVDEGMLSLATRSR